MDFYFETPVCSIEVEVDGGYRDQQGDRDSWECRQCVVSVGRSGSKWMETGVPRAEYRHASSNRVDIGVRVELPAVNFLPPDGRAI